MTAQSIAYHAHGTADGGKSCCYPWLVCHDIKSAMHCSLRLAPTMINHLTSLASYNHHRRLIGVDASKTRSIATILPGGARGVGTRLQLRKPCDGYINLDSSRSDPNPNPASSREPHMVWSGHEIERTRARMLSSGNTRTGMLSPFQSACYACPVSVWVLSYLRLVSL